MSEPATQLPAFRSRQHLARTLVALAVVQLLFWLVIYPWLFQSGKRPETMPISDAAVAKLAAPDLASIAAGQYESIELPHTECCAPGYRALRFRVQLDSVPEQGLAIIPNLPSDNLMIVVNGSIVLMEGRLELSELTYDGSLRAITRVPSGLLKIGSNEFVIVAVREVIPYFDMVTPLVGEYTDLRQALGKRAYMLSTYQSQTIAVGLVCVVLALLLVFRADQRRFALWMFLLVSAWTLRGLYFRWTDPPFSGEFRLLVYFSLTQFLPVAWLNFANQWTERPWPWLQRGSLLLLGLAILADAYFLFALGSAGYDHCGDLANVLGIGFGGLAVIRLLWHFARVPDQRYWEVALFVLVLLLMSIEFYWLWQKGVSTGHVQNTLPFLLIGFVAAFLGRNIRLFRSMNEINALLREQLAAREAELAQQYQRQGELLRRETLLDERRRLMGEMHDGIGGQLVSLMHASRHQAMTTEALHSALSEVVDELRLVIDSLDSVGSSINVALGNFRQRMAPRLRAAGITLGYRNDLIDEPTDLGPREVLHICRIVQEAVTNALKHAHCDVIELSICLEADCGQLVISVRDNGRGFEGEQAKGHGQDTMRARASAIDGTLTIAPAQAGMDRPGTLVELRLPRSHP